ncbi:AIPR family protein [Dyella humi]|uniref:AIPR family protein n=1 Tax=Dyella humi TaxID=1770547 RepID=A0ABW8IMA3_9GAMM
MELQEFLTQIQSEVREQMSGGLPFAEKFFAEIVMQHMAEAGMTSEPASCDFDGKVGNANLRLSGFALSDDGDQLDLFVSLYEGVNEITPITDAECKTAADQCLRFLQLCVEGKMAARLDPTHDARSLAETIHAGYNELDQIRIFVLTDKKSKSKNFKAREISGKTVRLEVMDIERLYRHISEGKPRDELIVDFNQIAGSPLPCVFVPGQEDYEYALAAIPGEALRHLYDRFGARLLEANVRSFLSARSKGVNAGIQKTLRESPDHFMAYNNGIVLVADEAIMAQGQDGVPGIAWLKGMQIVNGGQTTASLYFTKKKYPETDLSRVRVPAKIIILKRNDAAKEEALVSDISRFANSQNAVRQSDLSANKPYHIEVERLSLSVYCPDGIGRWFYERAAGSYATMLARETSPAKMKALKESIPPARKITKTDLAQYSMAWSGLPDVVSLGAQKCFDRFMASMPTPEEGEVIVPLDAAGYKAIVAKAIIYRAVQKLIRPMFPAFKSNVASYVVSLVARTYADEFRLERVWNNQGLSSELLVQISTWAREVNDQLHNTSNGRMISEWAKKPECRDEVLNAQYSPSAYGIPEVVS